MPEDFWEIPTGKTVRTPLSILREAASSLTEKTNGQLVGNVMKMYGTGRSRLTLHLALTVPALNNYVVQIIEYAQPLLMYPGDLEFVVTGETFAVANEVELVKHMRYITKSEKMIEIVESLMAQSQD